MVKTLGLIFLIVGTCIGAGFASGKEISNYFANYGLVSIIFTVLFGIAFYFLVKKSLLIGKTYEDKNSGEICQIIFGKVSFVVNLLIIISSIIIVSSMLAGSKEIGTYIMPKNYFVLIPIITVGVSFVILLGGFKSIDKLNLILIPVILIVIAVISFLTVSNGNIDANFFNFGFLNILSSLLATINYFCMTILLISVFLIQIGKNYSHKQIGIASVVSSVVITIFIIFVIVSLLIGGKNVLQNGMPLVFLAFSHSTVLGLFSSVAIWFGLVTTVITSSFVVIGFLDLYIRKVWAIVITLAVSYLVSLFGFAFIVVNFYAIIGVFGCYFVFYLIKDTSYKRC